MPPIPRRPPLIRSDLERSVRVAFIGDSLTNSTAPGTMGDHEYGAWAALLSGGSFIYGGKYGEGGMGYHVAGTSGGTFFGTYLPQVLAASPKPDYCVICMGQNDLGAITPAEIMAYTVAAAKRLRGAGIQPVLATLPPNDSVSLYRWYLNNAILATAARTGWPVVDLFAVCNPTNGRWQSGDTGDGTHPAISGAKKMGQVVVDQLLPRLPYWRAPLVRDAIDTTNTAPGLQLTDTNADGIANGWQGISNTAAGTFSTPDADDAEARGNWQLLSRTNPTGSMILRTQARLAASPGNLVAWSFRCKYENATAAGTTNAARLNASIVAASGPNIADAAVATAAGLFSLWQGDFPATTLYGEFVQPSGATHAYVEVNLAAPNSGATNGIGDFSIGQVTLRNLTTAGYAP